MNLLDKRKARKFVEHLRSDVLRNSKRVEKNRERILKEMNKWGTQKSRCNRTP